MKEQEHVVESSEQSTAATPTAIAKTGSGQMVVVEHISGTTQGNESSMKQKVDDKSGNTQVVCAEVHMDPEPGDEASLDVEKSFDTSESRDQLVV